MKGSSKVNKMATKLGRGKSNVVKKGKSQGKSRSKPQSKPKGKFQKKPSKGVVITASELKWKPIDIPDTLDDYGGFYGLEEIDGVDVKVVNGQVQFIAPSEPVSVVKEGEQKDEDGQEDKPEQSAEDKVPESEATGDTVPEHKVPEHKVPEHKVPEHKVLDDKVLENKAPDETVPDEIVSDETVPENKTSGDLDQELESNVFNSQLDLGDLSTPELPEWQHIASLSLTALHGLSKQGFTHPTDIQREVVPLALGGKDIIGKAATGSGKTLAYGIPILESLVKEKDPNQPIALIFTPTRELAQQVTQHLKTLGEFLVKSSPSAILSLTGGLSIQKQERLLKYKESARVVVATPGRFLELLEKNTDLVSRFARINMLVLDEADRLLQDGHFEEFERILKLLGTTRRSDGNTGWQTMIFSATFSLSYFSKLTTTPWKSFKEDEDEMEQVLGHLMQKIHFKSKPIIIDSNSEEKIKSQIKESLIECGPLERDLYSYYFLTVFPGTTLIFCNSIDSVKKLCVYFNNLNIDAFQIHSSMTQKNRLLSLERYLQQSVKNSAEGKTTVLVASDVAARGLDIEGIKHVIHYHLPRTADTYIHRSGRTARAGNEGVSVMICSPEEAMGPLRKLRKMLAHKNESEDIRRRKKWQKEVPLLPIESDIVRELRERSVLANELADHQLASASINKESTWMKQAAQDLGVDFDPDEEFNDAKNIKKRNKTLGKQEAKQVKARLNSLLSRPIRKDRRQKYLTGGFFNLADNLVKKRGHESIIGHEKMDALEKLKNKKKKT